MDRKSCNELRAYLANIAEQCGAAVGADEAALPSVVVLDNLQHASGLGDAFSGLLPPDNRNMPVIIGKGTLSVYLVLTTQSGRTGYFILYKRYR